MKQIRPFCCAAASILALGASHASAQTVTGTYAGNQSTGFGGPLGDSTLTVTEDNTGLITFSLATTGAFNNIAFYLDTTTGGISDLTGLNDTGDAGRRSISGDSTVTANAPVTFAAGFQPDYAVALDSVGNANLFQLTTGSNGLTLVTGANDAQNTTTNVYSFSFTAANVGLAATAGTSFSFVATLLNSQNGGQSGTDTGGVYRSNETIGTSTSDNNATANVGNGTLTFTGADTFTNGAVPEPATWAMLAGGLIVGGVALRRRSQTTQAI